MNDLKEIVIAVLISWAALGIFNLTASLVLTFLISFISKIAFGFVLEPVHKTLLFILLIVLGNFKVKIDND